MATVDTVFGQRVKRLRTYYGWSLRQLHEQSGVGINTLSRAENGADMYLSSAMRMAGALGVRLSDLTEPARCGECLDVPPPQTSCTVCDFTSPAGRRSPVAARVTADLL